MTGIAAALGLYRLLPAALRAAVEATAKSLVEKALSSVASDVAARSRGSAETRRIQRSLARAIAFTLARHRELNRVAFASDFREPPLADEVLRVLTDPRGQVDAARVRAAFATSHYDLAAIGLDGVDLLQEIRNRFGELLKSDPDTREVWNTAVLARAGEDIAFVKAQLERRREEETAASPLLTAEQFFAPWRRKKLFTHSWTLVGRAAVLDVLVAFGRVEAHHQVAVLPGRGGIGKSRLLLAVTEAVGAITQDLTVRVAADAGRVSAEDLARLPAGPVLIVVDDAHRRDDLELILAVARRRSDPTRVLLATRPYGSDAVRSVAARVGFDPSELLLLDELTDLERADRVALARQALGEAHGHLAEALADATQDSPLVTVVGGRLLSEEAVAPGLLSQHASFRDAVLGRMAEDYVHALGDWIDSLAAARILELISAIGPVRPEDVGLVEEAATFLNLQPDELRRALGEMQAAGILLRRGGTLRVTPDVLADYLYYRASVSAGQPTGYAARVYSVFASRAPASVLANLAELDWRASQAEEQAIDLLGEAWASLTEEFRAASYYGRMEILGLVERVAQFQPRRVLELVELAIDSPAPAGPPESKIWTREVWSQADVVEKLPPLLRRIAYHPECRRRALEHLWNVGRRDSRKLNQHVDHAIRTLAELTGYDSARMDMAVSVLEAVREWVHEEGAHDHVYSVLDVVDPILEKAGSRMHPEGHQISFSPYFVNPDTTRPIREGALQVVDDCLASPRLRVVLRAVESLASALRDPFGHFGSTPSDALLERWMPEQLGVMESLGRLADCSRDPLLTLAALEAVSWHACHCGRDVLRQAALGVVRGVTWDFNLLLTKHLTPGSLRLDPLEDCSEAEQEEVPVVDDEARSRWELRAARLTDERRRVADEFVARWPAAEDGAGAVTERLQTIADAGQDAAAGEFLGELARRHPSYGEALARACLANPAGALGPWMHALVAGLKPTEPEFALEMATMAAQSDHSRLRASAAAACGQAMYEESVDERYVELLRVLINDGDAAVRWRSIHALGALARHYGDKALEVALDAEVPSDPHLADEFFMVISMMDAGSFSDLDPEAVRQLLGRLEVVDDLGQHWIGEFLDHASEVAPDEVVQLIIRRASSGLADERPRFRVMPYKFESNFGGFGKCDGREDLLRGIRDLSLQNVDRPLYWLPELYSAVSRGYDEIGRSILQEWIESGDRVRIEAAADLLQEADWRFVFEHPDFVVNLLTRGAEYGEDCRRELSSALYRSVGTRGGTGTPGEPMPQDVEARDRAASIAESLTEGSVERAFYEGVVTEASLAIKTQLAWDAELGD